MFGDLLAAERERWALWTPVLLGSGIVCYFALPYEPPVAALAAAPILALLAYLARQDYRVFVGLLVLLAFALGLNAAQLETRMDMRPMMDKEIGPVLIAGRLMMTEVMPDGVRLTIKDPVIGRIDPKRTPEKIRIRLDNLTLADVPPTGSQVSLLGRVGPFSEPVAPGATDFRWQAYFKHLGGLGWAYGKVKQEGEAPAPGWRDAIALMFEHGRLVLANHVYARLSGDVAAMTAARLNGEQTAISQPIIEAMRIAGLAHLLSTSGFHVTIMGLLVYFPLRAFLALIPWIALRFDIKKWAAMAAIVSALGYTFLVGGQAATTRSMLMTGIAMLAIISDRRASPMRLVMLSALLSMLIAPDAALGPSFQMSFAAVFFLIAYNERAFGWATGDFADFAPEWLRSMGHHLWAIARTSLIATAATTPFAIYHFQTFSFYGFAANMLAIPLTSFWVMPCILLAYITVPFGLDGPFITGAGWGIAFTIKVAERVASWPYSIIYWPAMPDFVLAAITLGGLWLCLWRKRWRWFGLAPIIVGMLYPLYVAQPDVFVSPDGKEWAARLDDGRLAVSNIDHDAFTTQQWQERLGRPEMVDAGDLPSDFQQLRCDGAGCVYKKAGHALAFPSVDAAALEDCGRADVVVAPFNISDCGTATVIDDPALWRHGAHAIYFSGNGMRITSVRDKRGQRPWSVGWRLEN
jgi:competence protein ComEC